MRSLKGSFEESVIAYLFLLNIFPILIIPIMWIETKKFCQVLNNWTDFEVVILMFELFSPKCFNTAFHFRIFLPFLLPLQKILYYKVSGRVLPLNTRTKALLISIILPALSSLSVIVTHITMSEFKLFQVILGNLVMNKKNKKKFI